MRSKAQSVLIFFFVCALSPLFLVGAHGADGEAIDLSPAEETRETLPVPVAVGSPESVLLDLFARTPRDSGLEVSSAKTPEARFSLMAMFQQVERPGSNIYICDDNLCPPGCICVVIRGVVNCFC